MDTTSTTENNSIADMVLIGMFVIMIVVTTALSWHRFILSENFRYVTDENDTPLRLDLSTY